MVSRIEIRVDVVMEGREVTPRVDMGHSAVVMWGGAFRMA